MSQVKQWHTLLLKLSKPEEVKESKAQIIKQRAEREGAPIVEVPLVNATDIKDFKGRPKEDPEKLIERILKSNNGLKNKAMEILIFATSVQQKIAFFNWYFLDPEEGCVKYAKTEAHIKAIKEATLKIEPMEHGIWNGVLFASSVAYPIPGTENIPVERMLEKVLEILEYKAN